MIRRASNRGFTLLELMVGVIIFMVGIIGFSGMTIVVTQGNRQARMTDEMATLAQSAIEDLSGILWATLGTDAALPGDNGLNNALIRTEGPLNRLGQTIGTGTGPYSYYRFTVICPPSPTTGFDQAPSGSPSYCGTTLNANRPAELGCTTLSPALTSREKMMRVLVSGTDRAGKCHWKHVDSLSFNW